MFRYTELPSEAPLALPQDNIVSNREVGKIEFKSVNLRYNQEEAVYALRDITLSIRSGEKIGVVGRTGAGKSSLLQALFRMTEPEGDILIDGVLTREMGLHYLRRSISIIPQESLLFSDTLRKNLDPFSEFEDEEIWGALKKVEMESYVYGQTDGLQLVVTEAGSNLSAGQKQLICLARALLRNTQILVIDEATANVDQKTDMLIQKTLRKEFHHCTILTIAHRINTIRDSDRVLVLDAGRVAEFDRPDILLENPDGLFHKLATANLI